MRIPASFALSLLAFPFAAGCPQGTACTEIAVSSVQVTVTDTAGNLLDGATVTWSQDGGAAQDCEAFDGQYTCGYEVEGVIDVEASATGYLPGTGQATVTADECHVITESITIALEAENLFG
jgi:hypothetical protein